MSSAVGVGARVAVFARRLRAVLADRHRARTSYGQSAIDALMPKTAAGVDPQRYGVIP
jgi:hypothetical protein